MSGDRRGGGAGIGRDDSITGLAWSVDDPQYLEDPADYYRWLRDEEPVHFHAPSGSYFLSRFEDVWAATEDWRTFSSESPVARLRHIASMDPPDHDRLRARVARAFTPRRVAALEARVRAACREQLDALGGEREFDLVDRFTSHFPSRVIHDVMGIPEALSEPLRSSAIRVGEARDPESLAEAMRALSELTERLIDGDHEVAGPGILPTLLAESGDARLADADLRGLCSNLVLAGTDTVTNLIGNGIVLLSRDPATRARLAHAPNLVPGAVEEMLRFESPVQSLARRVRLEVTMHGVTLPVGAEVRLQWGAANRDDREFRDPDRFDVTRRIRRHLAFGHGLHFCLGAALARLECRVAFEELLARWPSIEVDEEGLGRLPSLWVRAWQRIPVRTGTA